MSQDIFDLIVVLSLAFFATRGFMQGFIGEIAGITSLIGGFWAARTWQHLLTPHLTFIQDPAWRVIAAYVLIFLAVIILVAVLAHTLQKILTFSFITWVDKLAGCLLGLTKGILLCALVLLILRKFFYDEAFMQNSRTLPYVNIVMDQIRVLLPPEALHKLGL